MRSELSMWLDSTRENNLELPVTYGLLARALYRRGTGSLDDCIILFQIPLFSIQCFFFFFSSLCLRYHRKPWSCLKEKGQRLHVVQFLPLKETILSLCLKQTVPREHPWGLGPGDTHIGLWCWGTAERTLEENARKYQVSGPYM